MITHKEVIAKMRSGETFSIAFRTFNRKLKTGGKLKELHSARLATTKVKDSKSNHFKHHTFDVEMMIDGQATDELMRVHLPLVVFFNGESCTP